jgi:PEP-CTERM motif
MLNEGILTMNTISKLALSLFAFTTLCLASVTSARADTVVFTNRAAFTAASTGLITINFEGIAPTNSVANFSSGLTLQGVTFTGNDSGMISVVDSGFFAPLFQFNSGAVLSGFAFIQATLPTGITAIGVDLMTTNPDGRSFDIVLSTGEVFTVSTPFRPERGFFGITSDIPISSIRFTTAPGTVRGIPLADNFAFGQAQTSAVPEPGTLTLLGAGIAAITALRRRGSRS